MKKRAYYKQIVKNFKLKKTKARYLRKIMRRVAILNEKMNAYK